MAKASARIIRSANNGPFVYLFEVNGILQNAAIGVASLNAALDAIKPLMAAVPGTIQTIVISETTLE